MQKLPTLIAVALCLTTAACSNPTATEIALPSVLGQWEGELNGTRIELLLSQRYEPYGLGLIGGYLAVDGSGTVFDPSTGTTSPVNVFGHNRRGVNGVFFGIQDTTFDHRHINGQFWGHHTGSGTLEGTLSDLGTTDPRGSFNGAFTFSPAK